MAKIEKQSKPWSYNRVVLFQKVKSPQHSLKNVNRIVVSLIHVNIGSAFYNVGAQTQRPVHRSLGLNIRKTK